MAYIDQYKLVAMDHQKRFQIPSSITLAQGLLESGAGNSQLTKESNNHFGIKCNNNWVGPKVFHDDDIKNDCFRSYNKADESYEDHSIFLSRNPRYAFLFTLNIRDYRGWAEGLQRAGYATDKSYANKLIKVIEDFQLYEFDDLKLAKAETKKESSEHHKVKRNERPTFISNELLYVVAKRGDTYEAIAEDMGFKVKDLAKYNETPEDFPLKQGDIVYLEKKNKKVKGGNERHVVKPGESMHSISQIYGIRMASLYKLNKLDGEYVPQDSDVLKLK
nr:glucosaminidase domain-containing protein [Parabacteroides sp. FAFU027]